MFELINNQVVIKPDMLSLPFFKVIWDSDKSKLKEDAFNQLSYIFYMCDFKSPYNSYPEDKRRELITTDILKNPKYKESKEIKEAMLKYRELIETPEIRLLNTWNYKIDELSDFLRETSFTEDNVSMLTKAGIDMEKIITSKQKLKEIVERQLEQNSTIRGGKKEALFEND